MSEDRFLDEFPDEESQPSKTSAHSFRPTLIIDDIDLEAPGRSRWMSIWEGLTRIGLAETTLRLGTHVLLVALILLVAWGMRQFYLRAQDTIAPREAAFAAAIPTATPTEAVVLPVFDLEPASFVYGITRQAHLHTVVPSRPRQEVTIYTVQAGDTLFAIAEKFGLQPETILWGNQFVLGDNPHNLRPDQELNILPVDGTYHKWSEGDGLNGVAKFFSVTPEDIINFPGNNLSPETIGDYSHPNIPAGTWLVVPGGKREFVSWSAPVIPLDNPKAAAGVLGPGACDGSYSGSVGIGAFVWPANAHFLSGFDYSPKTNHPAIDVDGETGDPVYAADSGVVVYAGWNNWGYGNMIVINHGNGWQTLYAHLDSYYVGCGQSMGQGGVIGTVGNTGNSSGSHLHFEMMYNGSKVNPHDYLP